MERTSRLRRYARKDYTQIVDFPVEIVGRDGQVRRYSYDDSVRLYQRRIRSAGVRYDDSELIAAESRHCRQRIEQLRRSYIERYGWGGLRDGLGQGILSTPLAAEVISFLRRSFPGEQDAASLSLTVLDQGEGDVVWLKGEATGRTWFLYLYRLDGEGPPGARAAWEQQLQHLVGAPVADGVERALAVREGPDLAMMLSGTGAWEGAPLVGLGARAEDPPKDDLDFWQFGLRSLHEGAVGEAVRLMEVGMEQAPLHRAFPQAASLLALLDNQPERAEFAARFGLVAHPEDPLLSYLMALCLARRGERASARAALGRRPRDPHLRVLLALLHLADGRTMRARVGALAVAEGGLVKPVARCRRGILALTLPVPSLAAGGLLGLAGLAALGFGGAVLPLLLLGACLLGPVDLILSLLARAWALRVLVGEAPAEARLVSLELLPRERAAPEN